MLQIQFKLFAKSRELLNKDSITIQANSGISLSECLNILCNTYIELTPNFLNKCRIAKDNKYIINKLDDIILLENSTFTIIPPISGG